MTRVPHSDKLTPTPMSGPSPTSASSSEGSAPSMRGGVTLGCGLAATCCRLDRFKAVAVLSGTCDRHDAGCTRSWIPRGSDRSRCSVACEVGGSLSGPGPRRNQSMASRGSRGLDRQRRGRDCWRDVPGALRAAHHERVGDMVDPGDRGCPSWRGRRIARDCRLAILDRYVAIKYLNDVTAPIVVCIVDRSVADDSAGVTIVEARLNNSRPVSVVERSRVGPSKGVEALAFTVAL